MVTPSTNINIPAIDIIRMIGKTTQALTTNVERLDTGLKINRAADDVGAFVFSNKLTAQVRALERASQNAQEAQSFVSTASSALSDYTTNLNSIRTKATEAADVATTPARRLILQSEISDKIDELNRIANLTSFGGRRLLNGALASRVSVVGDNASRLGASTAFGPFASRISANPNSLDISRTSSGNDQIAIGGTPGFDIGLVTQGDLRTTVAQFINGGTVAGAADGLAGLEFNRATLAATDVISVSGVLADGQSVFSGGVTIGAKTVADLATDIQGFVDSAETTAGVNGTGAGETSAAYNAATGRLEFSSVPSDTISQFNATVTVRDAGTNLITSSGTTYSNSILNEVDPVANTAQIGNSTTSVTGSTFPVGTYDIEVFSVTAAQHRLLESTLPFLDDGTSLPVAGNDRLRNSKLNGVNLDNNDVITIDGTNADGTTFSTSLTVSGADAGPGDGLVERFNGLISELNFRNMTATSYGFNASTASLAATGKIQLEDDVAATSATSLTITVNPVAPPGAIVNNSVVLTAGSAERAQINVDSGPTLTAEAGQIVTFQGTQLPSGSTPQVTFRIGTGIGVGRDELTVGTKTYQGSLNGGPTVTFSSGDTGVRFVSGPREDGTSSGYEYLTLDFDGTIGVTTGTSVGVEDFTLESTTRDVEFFLGALDETIVRFSLVDMRTENLGTSASNKLTDIDASTQGGATSALTVIDAAIEQTTAMQGTATSMLDRLAATESSLDVEAENIQEALTRITSADIAKETTELTINQLQLNVQSALLAQANLVPADMVSILFGLTSLNNGG